MKLTTLRTLVLAGIICLGIAPAHASKDDQSKVFIRPNPTVRPERDRDHDDYRDRHHDDHDYRRNRSRRYDYFTVTNNTDVDLYFDVNGHKERLQDEYLYPGETRKYYHRADVKIVFDYDLNRSGIQQRREIVSPGESFVFELDRHNYLRLVEDYGYADRHRTGRDRYDGNSVCHEGIGLCVNF